MAGREIELYYFTTLAESTFSATLAESGVKESVFSVATGAAAGATVSVQLVLSQPSALLLAASLLPQATNDMLKTTANAKTNFFILDTI